LRQAMQGRTQEPSGSKSALECADCGEPILEARRMAVPGCTGCIGCQKEHEHGNGILGLMSRIFLSLVAPK
jgi:phage/conjugal plasmid C-4 type zinc finger TraR family protein